MREEQEKICFFLDKDIKREFHTLCVKQGKTMSRCLRDFVEEQVRRDTDREGNTSSEGY